MTTRKKKPSAPAGNDGFSLISNEKLLALYAAMLKCRILQQRIRKLAGASSAAAFGSGHEASVVGAVLDLLPRDAISPPRGGLSPCMVKGVRLKTIFAWLGAQAGPLPPRYAPRSVIAPGADLAAQLKAACRAARQNGKAGNKNIVVLFCHSAQLMRGAALELLHAATFERLPILIVCHGKPGNEDIAPRAHDYGLPGITVDGEDVVAVYRVVSEAISHARRGNGPTLIECRPWVVAGRKKRASGNAIRNMEEYLSRKGLFSAKHKSEVAAQFTRELEKAAAKSSARR